MNLLVLMLAAAPLLDVKWDENTARTGKLLVVDVAVAETVSPMDTLKVAIDDKEGVFAFTDIERRRARALLPVHVDRKLGKATVTIDATLDDGTFTRWQKPVVIRDGKYDKRHITVGKQFTSP